ncbi:MULTISPECIES: bifunctional nuclease family protein [unclassified Corynebacterium]
MLEPEEFLCALFRWNAGERVVPVWMSPIDGARVAAHLAGAQSRRPDTHELLIEVLNEQGGLESAVVTSYHEGVFIVELTTGDGAVLDSRMSDALILADHFDVPIEIEEEELNQVAVFVSAEDLHHYVGVEETTPGGSTSENFDEASDGPDSASGDAQADADFSAMMQQLGMTEDDFRALDPDDFIEPGRDSAGESSETSGNTGVGETEDTDVTRDEEDGEGNSGS